jgi:riboflavin biosynthesis pyrimidine reductase
MARLIYSDVIRRMKASADRDLAIGGPGLTTHAFRAGLVDECHLFLAPVVVGGGTRSLPDGVRFGLGLVDERRFSTGFVYLGYRVES